MGRPTRLVPLTDMMRSPMLRAPQRSAGPPWSRLATITVGRMEPQPDSTTATPTISLGALEMDTWTQTVWRWFKRKGGFHGWCSVGKRCSKTFCNCKQKKQCSYWKSSGINSLHFKMFFPQLNTTLMYIPLKTHHEMYGSVSILS